MKFYQIATPAVLAAALLFTPALQAADEAKALAVLASSDADLHAKALACDELGRAGTAKAVPALAELLADEKLNDYARDGLERIPDPAAGKALVEGLKTLKGALQVSVIISVGDRGDASAVPELAKIAKGMDATATSAALTALAQIANEDAGKVIHDVLASGSAEAKTAAAHAALLAAEQMERGGQKEAAGKLRKAAAAQGVPARVK